LFAILFVSASFVLAHPMESNIEISADDNEMDYSAKIDYSDDKVTKYLEISDLTNVVSAKLKVYGKSEDCPGSKSHYIEVNHNPAQRIYFNPCDVFCTSFEWENLDIPVNFLKTGKNSFLLTDTSSWTESNMRIGIDEDTEFDKSDICWGANCNERSDGELMLRLELAQQEEVDLDGDGILDNGDNCPYDRNPDQADRDDDNIGDICDNCANAFNLDQVDSDDDGVGDACDKCPEEPETYNKYQDEDGCPDTLPVKDSDGDGILDNEDNCPYDRNPDQADRDDDNIGDVCDNCPNAFNQDQVDSDDDGIGDACDKCPEEPETYNNYQDEDGCPDALPVKDSDGDGVPDDIDVCDYTPAEEIDQVNKRGCGPSERDTDKDGIVDKEDQCPNQPETFNGYQDEDGCPDTLSEEEEKDMIDKIIQPIKNIVAKVSVFVGPVIDLLRGHERPPGTAQRPDLVVYSLTFSPESPWRGNAIAIDAVVNNTGAGAAKDILVEFWDVPYETKIYLGNDTISSIQAGSSGSASIVLQNALAGKHKIKAVIDPNRNIKL